MAYDGIVTSAVVWELSGLLINGRIDKVVQSEPDEIALGIYAGGENYRLLISANAGNPRLHLTRVKKEAPLVAPPFCMVLRKYIQGGRLSGISQEGYDRVIHLDIDHPDEMGFPQVYRLSAEIMGKHSNIVLTNQNGTILDAIKHVDSSQNSYREVMPGRKYILPPPQDKISPDEPESAAAIFAGDIPEDLSGLHVHKYILQRISGFSPLLCRSICAKVGIEPTTMAGRLTREQRQTLSEALADVCRQIAARDYHPRMLLKKSGNPYLPDEPVDVHCLSCVSGELVKSFSTVNLMLDEFYGAADAADRLRQKKANTAKNISLAIERCQRKLAEQQATIKENENHEELRVTGELLTANLYMIRPGMDGVEVLDYYADPPASRIIPLDPKIPASNQAQSWFRKYRKAKSSYEMAGRYAHATEEELRYLEGVRQMLETCTLPDEIAEVRAELAAEGYIKFEGKAGRVKSKKASRKVKEPAVTRPMKFTSSEGYEILVGKNNRQNDQLTMKTASPRDVWLHVRNAPGSHVIIRMASVPGGLITDKAIEEAAALAAWYSSQREAPAVDVDFTEVKNVKKPSGARPGMVNYFNFSTVRVRPLPSVGGL